MTQNLRKLRSLEFTWSDIEPFFKLDVIDKKLKDPLAKDIPYRFHALDDDPNRARYADSREIELYECNAAGYMNSPSAHKDPRYIAPKVEGLFKVVNATIENKMGIYSSVVSAFL